MTSDKEANKKVQLSWFVGIWLASVLGLALFSLLIRWVLLG
ncbi:DUF2474 domain-containing protein [Vibrio taketomensis]|nr:DUF2474 domain-containing protein [Vibrio taketomensis]